MAGFFLHLFLCLIFIIYFMSFPFFFSASFVIIPDVGGYGVLFSFLILNFLFPLTLIFPVTWLITLVILPTLDGRKDHPNQTSSNLGTNSTKKTDDKKTQKDPTMRITSPLVDQNCISSFALPLFLPIFTYFRLSELLGVSLPFLLSSYHSTDILDS